MTHTSLKETQKLIDSAEFGLWKAMYQREPWGDDWEQTAVVEAAVMNAYRKRAISPAQLMPGTKALQRQSRAAITRNMELWRKSREAEMRRKAEKEKAAKAQNGK